jgi:predicted  nucleic acid-binding Zn-ribbon protein
MDTAQQHFLESETDRETQTEELSNYSGEETPRIKRKQRQTQPRNSKQKQQCQLLVQQDRGRGCQHFASLQSKKRSRRSSQSRQATPHSELDLASDVDFVAGSDTHDGQQARRTRSLSQDFLSKDDGWQAHRTRSLSQDFLKGFGLRFSISLIQLSYIYMFSEKQSTSQREICLKSSK